MGDRNDTPDVETNTDVGSITDVTVLKAMAYDQIVALEQVQNNLRVINERISQVTVASNGAFASAMAAPE